ncbi:MAG: hypothetical protein R2991_09795 [Thermoanaerobaculia bacterium]
MSDLERLSVVARRLGGDFTSAGLSDEARILAALMTLVTAEVPRTVVHIHGEPVTYEEAYAYLYSLAKHPTAWPSLEIEGVEPAEWEERLARFADELEACANERGLTVGRQA